MANFATETEVRDKFQLTDTILAPTALITTSIDDAHEEVLRFLDPAYDVPSPEAALVSGEVLLAGAHALRSLASKDAAEQKHVSVGGSRVDSGNRFHARRSCCLAIALTRRRGDLCANRRGRKPCGASI